jgi:hypothetical protein
MASHWRRWRIVGVCACVGLSLPSACGSDEDSGGVDASVDASPDARGRDGSLNDARLDVGPRTDGPAPDAPDAREARDASDASDSTDARADASDAALDSSDAPDLVDAGSDRDEGGDAAEAGFLPDAEAGSDGDASDAPGETSTTIKGDAGDAAKTCDLDAAALGPAEWRIGCAFVCEAPEASVECYDDAEGGGAYVVSVTQTLGKLCPGGPSHVLVQFPAGATLEPGDYAIDPNSTPDDSDKARVEIKSGVDNKTWTAQSGTIHVETVGDKLQLTFSGVPALSGKTTVSLSARLTCP